MHPAGENRDPPMPFWLRLIVYVAAAYLILCALAFFFQRRFLYFPDSAAPPVPRGPGLAGIEAVSFPSTDGVRLEAFWWPGERATTILLFHGNAGNRASRVAWMQGLHERGWPVLLLDYRGYGGSEGTPSEEGFARDADAAAAWLDARGHDRQVYLASSIGCGVAVGLAARRAAAGLIVQSGAVDLAPVARKAYPFLPMGLLMRDRFDVRTDAASVHAPSLSIHGDEDRIVPLSSGRALHEALGGPKTFWEVAGAGHNDVVGQAGPAWYDRVHAFLTGLEDRTAPASAVK